MFLGLDIGTQAARAVVCTADGAVLADATQALSLGRVELPPGWAEQDAETWWAAGADCLSQATTALRHAGRDPAGVRAIAVDSTSGTVVPVDERGSPLRPALMYNDTRATEEAARVNAAGSGLCAKLGYRFAPSFALPRILWLKRHEPHVFGRTHRFLHAADFVVARLTGRDDISDTSNALKTGVDLVERAWPAFIERDLDIPLVKLPQIATPGDLIGEVTAAAAEATGLAPGTPVVAGCTDGTAAFIASGAAEPGHVNSNLGTTLVVRSVSSELVRDDEGRVYCHAHPDGYWLPGGASNVGGEILEAEFRGADYAALDEQARACVPTNLLAYPLARAGERLPFVSSDAQGFLIGEPHDDAERFAAYLEGVGFVERWIYELLSDLGAEPVTKVFVTGGGARSSVWLGIRASILNLPLHRPAPRADPEAGPERGRGVAPSGSAEGPARAESAFGAAILAASRTHYRSLLEACAAMVRVDEAFEPDPSLVDPYSERYQAFRVLCTQRGYR